MDLTPRLTELTKREIAAFGCGVLVALACFHNGFAQARQVPSGSMEPTFRVGDRVLVLPAWSRSMHVERGEVLTFTAPFGAVPGASAPSGLFALADDRTYMKRAIGLPGDLVEIKANEGVYLNGRLLAEPYAAVKPRFDWGPERVPPGKLFMLGDNRSDSFDSRYWGFLPMENVTGRPAAVIWPPAHWRRM